jgi:hypothetical protein
VGSRGKALVRGQGAKPSEADDILILGYRFSALRMHLRHTYAERKSNWIHLINISC